MAILNSTLIQNDLDVIDNIRSNTVYVHRVTIFASSRYMSFIYYSDTKKPRFTSLTDLINYVSAQRIIVSVIYKSSGVSYYVGVLYVSSNSLYFGYTVNNSSSTTSTNITSCTITDTVNGEKVYG